MLRSLSRSLSSRKHLDLSEELSTSPGNGLGLFDIDEIVLGAHIASGRYSDSFEIKEFRQRRTADSAVEQFSRDYMTKHVRKPETNKARYAIKLIRKEYMDSFERLEMAATDLSNDAEVMSKLQHRNIMKLCGTSTNGTEDYINKGRHDGYFIIFERLEETFEQKMSAWIRQKQGMKSRDRISGFLKRTDHDKKAQFLAERLQVAHDIADALEYMHQHGIVHGSLDIDHVGFTTSGKVQVFDFGTATQLSQDDKIQSDIRRSPRTEHYQSPEVYFADAYDCKADVYSFATLLCEIISLCIGSRKKKVRKSANNISKIRSISASAYSKIMDMLERGWSINPENRPKMAEMRETLADILNELSRCKDTHVHLRRCRHTLFYVEPKSFEKRLARDESESTELLGESFASLQTY